MALVGQYTAAAKLIEQPSPKALVDVGLIYWHAV
jgi:hypothetical protein